MCTAPPYQYYQRVQAVHSLTECSYSYNFSVNRTSTAGPISTNAVNIISIPVLRYNINLPWGLGPFDKIKNAGFGVTGLPGFYQPLPREFKQIIHFPEITFLDVSGRVIGNTDAETIIQLQNIEQLHLSGSSISMKNLHKIIEGCQSIRVLDLSEIRLSSSDFSKILNSNKQLKTLHLSGCGISGKHADSFRNYPLKNLNLGDNDIDNRVLEVLGSCYLLEDLSISASKKTLSQFGGIGKLSNLKVLYIDRSIVVENKFVQGLLHTNSLETLFMRCTPLSSEGVKKISRLPSLKLVSLCVRNQQSVPSLRAGLSKYSVIKTYNNKECSAP